MRNHFLLLLCSCLLVLSSCVTQGPVPQVSPLKSPLADSPIASPVSKVDQPANAARVRFRIDLPVKTGAVMITGQGPAGVPISINSVTTMGNELAAGVIGADNRFAISVPPLEPNVRIGIAIGDLAGTRFSAEEFNADDYKGDEALVVPMVGYFLDTAMVLP